MVVVNDRFGFGVEIQCIDRKVTACSILQLCAEDIVAEHAALIIGLRTLAAAVVMVATESGDLDRFLPHHHMHDLEPAPDDA